MNLRHNALNLALVAALVVGATFVDPSIAFGGAALATRRSSSGGKKKNTISVDLTDVESTGGRITEGDYLLEVSEAEVKTGKDSGEDYIALTFEVAEGEFKGRKVYHNCSLQAQALFNLRSVLEALGVDIPKKGALDLDVDELVGMKCGAALQNEKYDGKEKARPVEFFPASELEDAGASGKKEDKKDDKKSDADESGTKKKKKSEPTFEVGDKVTFVDDDKEEQSGKITDLDGDKATVKVGKDEWEIDVSELTKA